MPVWFTIAYDILKSLLTGAYIRWWAGHKEKEADNAVNKDMAATGAAMQQRLREKWTRD